MVGNLVWAHNPEESGSIPDLRYREMEQPGSSLGS
jgi:hypothetical protein